MSPVPGGAGTAVAGDTPPPLPGEDPLVTFRTHRPVLFGLAYRLLGSVWEAEDCLQEAAVRWLGTRTDEVRDPRGFLVTVVTRLALDRLRSARARREQYVGPWLPEPLVTRAGADELLADLGPGPQESVERDETLSLAVLRLMERLTPPERAVYVLREAFELPYARIATVLGLSEEHCRQLYRRARERVRTDRPRFTVEPAQHRRLLARLLRALREGDLAGLYALLDRDVVVWTDGGGRVRAARNPVRGREKAARFALGVARRVGDARVEPVTANGLPALLLTGANSRFLVSLVVDGGLITQVLLVSNPDKLPR